MGSVAKMGDLAKSTKYSDPVRSLEGFGSWKRLNSLVQAARQPGLRIELKHVFNFCSYQKITRIHTSHCSLALSADFAGVEVKRGDVLYRAGDDASARLCRSFNRGRLPSTSRTTKVLFDQIS